MNTEHTPRECSGCLLDLPVPAKGFTWIERFPFHWKEVKLITMVPTSSDSSQNTPNSYSAGVNAQRLIDIPDAGIGIKGAQEFVRTGERREFSTGARRDANNDKGRMDLLPWLGLIRLSKHFQKGANTHGERNWELGMPISVLLDSTMRHLAKAQAGLDDEDHITAAYWGISCIVDELERIKIGTMDPSINNVPNLK